MADEIGADGCQFPSAVMPSNGCSGSLIAPTIVLTASHCLDPELTSPVVAVSFGEGDGAEAFSVPTVRCDSRPGYEIFEGAPPQALNDVGSCELAMPVDDIPPIPIIYGCEVEALEVGAPLTIVGFGGSSGSNNDPGNPP
ncbi:MAG: S1 family peptidase [Deltaproteobacteria bacterium]|nr:S1 family peptidase [Deltaproteobacteria bacterium]